MKTKNYQVLNIQNTSLKSELSYNLMNVEHVIWAGVFDMEWWEA